MLKKVQIVLDFRVQLVHTYRILKVKYPTEHIRSWKRLTTFLEELLHGKTWDRFFIFFKLNSDCKNFCLQFPVFGISKFFEIWIPLSHRWLMVTSDFTKFSKLLLCTYFRLTPLILNVQSVLTDVPFLCKFRPEVQMSLWQHFTSVVQWLVVIVGRTNVFVKNFINEWN